MSTTVPLTTVYANTRNGTATYVQSDGTVATQSALLTRTDHWISGQRGRLFEPSRTNSIRNSTMVGATAGTLDTTGSLPTNWSMSGIATSSVTVATGTESGLAYTELRVNGTPTAPVRIFLDTATGIAASAGQNWTFSTWMKLESGTLTNVDNVQVANNRYTSGGAFHSANSVFITLTSTSQRFSFPDTSIDDADGSGTIESIRPRLQFTWTSGAVDFTVRIYGPQMELGSTPSSYIPTSNSAVTRAAETLTIPAAKLPYSATAMSIQMDGLETFADEGSATQETLFDWRVDSNNRITLALDTDSTKVGTLTLTMVNGSGTDETISTTAELTPGVDDPFNVAIVCTSNEIGIALDGTAETRVSHSIGLPDLSGADATLGGNGTRALVRAWNQDITDAGIEEAST